ncbi:Exodeoxyribonuclease VII large subunit [hydrothermal vent metagenome]|uniref:Exodeoxyribonuclease VII large subunit n=1 Tax=hydrothermal vent metagenome TaxID=652676 RepID=A0A3B0YTI9_9ZZZZ
MFERDIFTVSRLNKESRLLIETRFPTVWVEGEISNLAQPASGHVYFTLKDKKSQIRCAMFRNRRERVPFNLQDGIQVLARVKVSLYEARGDFQLIVEHLELSGEGALRQAFEALKNKLQIEGLFANETKRELPYFPQQIGIITSPTGAAVKDILSVLANRCPTIPVLIYPAVVQGDESVASLLTALKQAQAKPVCDVLIIARGGGSIEDLNSFNDETLARTIHACSIPIVSAIGHEIDFTIADFVSDWRSPTPSAAAEKVSPDQFELLARIASLAKRLAQVQQQQTLQLQQRLDWAQHRLQQQHPAHRVQILQQRLKELDQRQHYLIKQSLNQAVQQLHHIESRLLRLNPALSLPQRALQLDIQSKALRDALQQQLAQHQHKLNLLAQHLNTVSPLATLDRGYSIITTNDNQEVLCSTNSLKKGDQINAQLAKGSVDCTVNKVYK